MVVSFPCAPVPELIVSPIGVVPKKERGQFRLIQHLSWPEGSSVNDFISAELSSVSYSSVDVARRMVASVGPGALMAKCDIKPAFRLLPVHPADFQLLGIQFEGSIFVDKALPMGCSISCALFERFSTFLQWVFSSVTGKDTVTHYLDDFFLVGRPGSADCQQQLEEFQGLMGYLGVPLAPEKTQGPCVVLSFLGIELDSVQMEARLPGDKKRQMLLLLVELLGKAKVLVREVQVLLGHLNFACRVV